MAQFCANNRDLACYLVTKHSWKGKYKRIFSIGTLAISTYSPQTLEITNQWPYGDFLGIKASPKNATSDSRQDEFIIQVKIRGKKDTMRFSSDYTAEILTECLNFSSKFGEKNVEPFAMNAYKHSWTEQRIPVILRANSSSIEQVDNQGVVVQNYYYKDIRSILKVSDCPGGFVLEVGEHRRKHMFACANCDDLLKEARRLAAENIGVSLFFARDAITLNDFSRTRLGLCSADEMLTSYVEFKVQKWTKRHDVSNAPRRLLCLSESCLVERDPSTYAVICATPLRHIVCVVRLEKDPQQFLIEYQNGARLYSAPERDLILASLLDGTRASGNEQVFVTGHRFDRNLRLLPHNTLLDADSESQCMRHVISPPPGLRRSDLIRRFNANIPYNGLTYAVSQEGFFSENKGKIIVAALDMVLSESYEKDDPAHIHKCEAQMQCLRRLFASKSGFQSFTEVPGIREKLGKLVVTVLALSSEAVDHAVMEALCSLMHPMHDNFILRTEQLNKQSLLSSPKFVEHLLDLAVGHVKKGTGWLVIASMLDFLTYAICPPFSETTTGETFDVLLKMVAARGQSFYKLFQSPSMTIVKGAGMVMRAIIEESDLESSKSMQMLALTEGALLTHLRMALLATGKDLRVLTNKQLSGHLIALWIADNKAANELLQRILPRGLLNFLDSDEKPSVKSKDLLLQRNNLEAAMDEQRPNAIKDKIDHLRVTAEAGLERFIQHWDLEEKLSFLPKRNEEKDKNQAKPVILRRRRQRIKSRVNWALFAFEFARDHAKADLVWNEKTREEFRHSIEGEVRALLSEKEQAPKDLPISWNHTEFQTRYSSLEEEVKIGDYYLRLLLAETDDSATPIHNPIAFMNEVYHRFLLSVKSEMRCLCLRAMAVTYARHHETIGPFTDAKHLVSMLTKCTNVVERDHFVLLLCRLSLNKENVVEMIVAGVLPILVDLAVLAHLHVQRAKIQNQSNVIEASAEQMADGGALEWYYNDKASQRQGPVSFQKMKELYAEKEIFEKTPVWAAGMEQWQNLSSVAQFRWTVCSTQAMGLYNLTQLCTMCLDMLIQMCEFFPSRDEYGSVIRPLCRVKKCLTEPVLLYQIVQLLLTYDPAIVQRVATLLLLVIQDNPFLPRLYLSGVFFFILMYNGSNVLPIARLLHYAHAKQAFRSALPQLEETKHSILSSLLPSALIFYLEEYGADKYAEVFLGEFDNPEVIWNTAMRRHLIERIALHIADFSHRLTSNVKALYQYCPIPLIDYPELDKELFCHVYYLRHLCNRQRFPDWPIRDPIVFVRCCLAAWYNELEKKGPSMSLEQACELLGIDMPENGPLEAAVVRKAYFRLATKYHPDKNADGREMFERINAAYELLSSDAARENGPDSNRIVLCLQAQSIVYSRFSTELSEFKYAGYSQLIRTIELEANDAALFQKGGGILLSAAVELTNYTLVSSALNAEQLRREQGLEALHLAFDRCVPMVTLSSTPEDTAVQVCEHICNCFGTAASFEGCREKLAEMSSIFTALCRLLQFSNLTRLASAAAQCVCKLSVDTLLQLQLFQAGVVWQLLPLLFRFDWTLDEGGVSHDSSSNAQSQANTLARDACEAVASLAGYREHTPENDGVQRSLNALVTPYVCRLMQSETNDKVLKVLNSNSEDPYLIWDNGTRGELLEFVERYRTSSEQSDMFGAEFKFSVHSKELIVGDIFVRIYNEQPTFPLLEPKKTAVDLLDYMLKHSRTLSGEMEVKEIDWRQNGSALSTDQAVLACVNALTNVMAAYPGVELLLIGRFSLLLTYLRARSYPLIQKSVLQLLNCAVANRECVNDVANVNISSTLFVLFSQLPPCISLILNILIALSSNGQLVKEMLEYGGVLYMLQIFCNSDHEPPIRLLSSELLAKLQADKLTGPRWTRFINKFLPPIFADALRDAPNTAMTMYDSTNENPELIWNNTTRSKVRKIVEDGAKELSQEQSINPLAKWTAKSLADDSTAYSDSTCGELVVGGVFVRLFVANPAWSVRHPRQFATELIEKVLELMQHPTNDLILVSNALVQLLRHHSNTAEQLPAQGYLMHLCTAMCNANADASRAAILVFREIADNENCAEALARVKCMEGLLHAMKQEPAVVVEATYALKAILKKNNGEAAAQLLNSEMLDYALELLKSPLPVVSSVAKAHVVDALKSACLDLHVGAQISAKLDASPVWSQYKHQRHDLFLPASNTHAITGGTTVAGYLTEGMFSPPPLVDKPPPLGKPNDL